MVGRSRLPPFVRKGAAVFPWETLNIYSRLDPRWFEPLERYVPDGAHLAAYRELMPLDWSLRRRGLWFLADPPAADRREQGWKLHVSVRAVDSVAALRAAIPVLRDADTKFKFLLDQRTVSWTNGRMWPRGSSGKFITVYPADDDLFRRLAAELTAALDGLTGPYILSDRRYRDSATVHYRYGGFIGISQIQATGVSSLMIKAPDGSLYPDVRQPYWQVPPWIAEDPFGIPADEDTSPDTSPDTSADTSAGAIPETVGGDQEQLLDGRFRVDEALQFSNRGGVYVATDVVTGAQVVLKEARPQVGLGKLDGDLAGIEYTDVLRKEHRLLTELAGTGHFVRPVALFTEWEHTFLAEEKISGPQFSQHSIATNPLVTGELTPAALAAYHDRMRQLFGQFVAALDAAHRRGIVLGDLSWTNVLLDEDSDRLIIIDLEAAVQGTDANLGLYTPGVSSPRSIRAGRATPADDYSALGRILFGSLMLLNGFVGYQPAALGRLLDALAADLGLPADLVELVRELTAEPDAEPDAGPPDATLVAKRFAELSVAEPAAWPSVIPLARPAAEVIAGERAGRLRAEVAATVGRAVDYLHATATPHRDDRLFPTDVGGFETNPLSVANGAAGVLHALRHLPGEVPGHLVGWVLRRDVTGGGYPPGLYYGQGGIAWVLAEFGHPGYAAKLLEQTRGTACSMEHPGVLWGAAGHGMACLRLWQLTGRQEFLDDAVHIGEHLTGTAQLDDRGVHWLAPGPDGGQRVPLGYAHGPAGVALFLLYLHLAAGDGGALALGRQALDFELANAMRLSDRVTGFRGDLDESKDRACRCYWDMGTAGVLTTLVRYLAVTGDQVLDGWVDRLLPDVSRKYTVLPQLFHGLAGLGNALIDVAELAGRPAALAEAWRTAEGVLLFRVEQAEGTVFPGEQSLRESGDLATGSAGVGLFLNRLLTVPADPAGGRTNTNFVLDDLLPTGAGGSWPAG